MTFVSRLDVTAAELPFRFSFGHALAVRRSSSNVYVKVTLSDGSAGFGEGVPREYVTGETDEDALAGLTERYAPALLGRELPDVDGVPQLIEEVARCAARSSVEGAARCALELALLDACGKRFGCSVRHWLGPLQQPIVRYSAVIPFSGSRGLALFASLARLAGMRQIKVKVGIDLERDLQALRLLRRVFGAGADLRVDANCAWSADEAIDAIAAMRQFRITAVEQPVPAEDLDGLRKVTAATEELIIADESLRTVEEAEFLARTHACDAFNIRVSKCGGLLNSARIARIAADAGLACVVGAQVGESGILSAAGRHLASTIEGLRYVEGSAGRLLLKEDLIRERVLWGWGGRARTHGGPGLGVRVKETTLRKYESLHRALEASTAKVEQAL